MGMTILQLLSSAWPQDRRNAINVRVIKQSVHKMKGAIRLRTQTNDMQLGQKRNHRQEVYLPAHSTHKGPLNKAPEIMFSCDCARFLYYHEYALARRGAAEIIYGNGDPPNTTNPTQRPGICKHGLKVLEFIVKLGL